MPLFSHKAFRQQKGGQSAARYKMKENKIMASYTRKNVGTCSRSTTVELNEDNTIRSIEIMGGCDGNLKGISQLLVGMDAQDAIQRMQGTTCGPRSSSCPDQIAQCLKEALAQQGL